MSHASVGISGIGTLVGPYRPLMVRWVLVKVEMVLKETSREAFWPSWKMQTGAESGQPSMLKTMFLTLLPMYGGVRQFRPELRAPVGGISKDGTIAWKERELLGRGF